MCRFKAKVNIFLIRWKKKVISWSLEGKNKLILQRLWNIYLVIALNVAVNSQEKELRWSQENYL